MPKYTPLVVPVRLKAGESDMISLSWAGRGISAWFEIPGNASQALQVAFFATHVVRILDEMPISTEAEPTPQEGIIPNHFAYEVEGSLFQQSQSQALFAHQPTPKHYRFLTGWTCLDVIADNPPEISVGFSPTLRE